MTEKYAGWKIPVPTVSTYHWTEKDWEEYTERAGICPKCIKDATEREIESFYAQYNPAPGTPFKIVKPVSDMERELLAKRPDETYTLSYVSRSSGYYVCEDQIHARWCLHPEALQQVSQ